MHPSVQVQILRKTTGRQFSESELNKRFPDRLGTLEKITAGGEVIVKSPFGKTYRFNPGDVLFNHNNNNTIMENELIKLTLGQRLRLSAGDKAKVRAGLLEAGNLGLTNKGKELLLAMLAEKFDEELTQKAQDIITEIEEERRR